MKDDNYKIRIDGKSFTLDYPLIFTEELLQLAGKDGDIFDVWITMEDSDYRLPRLEQINLINYSSFRFYTSFKK